MILSFKKFDNLLLYLSLKVGVNFMNSQHLRLKWHFEKLDKYGPWILCSDHSGHNNVKLINLNNILTVLVLDEVSESGHYTDD